MFSVCIGMRVRNKGPCRNWRELDDNGYCNTTALTPSSVAGQHDGASAASYEIKTEMNDEPTTDDDGTSSTAVEPTKRRRTEESIERDTIKRCKVESATVSNDLAVVWQENSSVLPREDVVKMEIKGEADAALDDAVAIAPTAIRKRSVQRRWPAAFEACRVRSAVIRTLNDLHAQPQETPQTALEWIHLMLHPELLDVVSSFAVFAVFFIKNSGQSLERFFCVVDTLMDTDVSNGISISKSEVNSTTSIALDLCDTLGGCPSGSIVPKPFAVSSLEHPTRNSAASILHWNTSACDPSGSIVLFQTMKIDALGVPDEVHAGLLDAGSPRGTLMWTPLQYASAIGDDELARELLVDHKSDPLANGRTKYQYAPLHVAVRFGHAPVVDLLLDTKHANEAVAATDAIVGASPLHIAVVQGSLAMVEKLLPFYSTRVPVTTNGTTPYELAKRLGHVEMAQILRNHDERLRRKQQLGDWLASIGMMEYAPLLERAGYDDAQFLLLHGLSDATLDGFQIQKEGHRIKLQSLYMLREFLDGQDAQEIEGDESEEDDGAEVATTSGEEGSEAPLEDESNSSDEDDDETDDDE